jgi:fructokinase
LGEVLFDHFPDGSKILGGAPFNVAWNLRGLGEQPLFVSAVGNDSEGKEVRRRMSQWNLDVSGLQVADGLPTGRVSITLDDGQPHFEIVEGQAYDRISPPELADDGDSFAIFYHGSLVFRSQRSRTTLTELIGKADVPRFVDINIRRPHFDRAWLSDLLPGASWVKLNDDELSFLTGIECGNSAGIETAVGKLRHEFGPGTYFVTSGARGAYAFESEGSVFAAALEPTPFRDTVGAGDAFSAATVSGLVRGLPLQQILSAAVRLASRVCSITGATSSDESVYQEVFDEDKRGS